jgi:hypothetical protein
MKFSNRILWRTLPVFVIVPLLILLLLNVPYPLFSTSVSANNLTLYSDRMFEAPAGQHVLELAAAKLAQSPLYSAQQKHQVFLCNATWRQRLFFLHKYGVAGVNYYPFTTNVFMRNSIVDENALIGPSGNRASGERTLDYFIAHEITHTLTGQAIGKTAYMSLPEWKREGYADYVARKSSFNYEEAKHAFLVNDPKMDPAKSGLYLRFNLLVAHLLDKKHWTVQQLLTTPIEQASVEEMVRAEKD